MRKYLGLAVIATLLATGCTTQEAGAADPQTSVVVSPNGGSYAVGGMTVAVPKGAVANPTLLTVGDTRVVSGVNAPLGGVAVRFNISLQGGMEPAQPLQLAIPLAGRFLPAGELDVKNVTPQSLPLTISLLTSNNGLLGEALWDVVKVMVEFYTGENAEGTAKLVQGLIVDVPDVNKCLVGVFNARSGNIGDFLQALPDAVFGKCGETIGNALIKLLPDAASLINPFTRTLAILQATWEVLQGAWHAAIAVAQTAQGPVKVTIEPACPTKQQFEQAFIGWNAGDSQHRVVSATATSNPTDPNLVCEDAWAIDGMSFTIDNIAPPNNSVGAGVIEHWVNGKWTIVFVSQDMRSDEVCRQVPPKIKQQMQCFN